MLLGTAAYDRRQESSENSHNGASIYLHLMKASISSDRDEAEPDWSAGVGSSEELIQSKDSNTAPPRNKTPYGVTPAPMLHTLSAQHAFWKQW